MTTRTCPVCEHEQDHTRADCARCGWDFSPLLGTSEQVRAVLSRRLDEARTAWRQRRCNPELVPELERDPFETPEEFAARLSERPWYVGDGELQKSGYDLATRRFPLRLRNLRAWTETWLNPSDAYYLDLPRDQARSLYQRGQVWPVCATLSAFRQVRLTGLTLVAPDREFPILIETPRGTPNAHPSPCSDLDGAGAGAPGDPGSNGETDNSKRASFDFVRILSNLRYRISGSLRYVRERSIVFPLLMLATLIIGIVVALDLPAWSLQVIAVIANAVLVVDAMSRETSTNNRALWFLWRFLVNFVRCHIVAAVSVYIGLAAFALSIAGPGINPGIGSGLGLVVSFIVNYYWNSRINAASI
ncbi:hypothetical protein [Candidatus Thiodictyon syntrophicum]|jgi:hypothetical protein|uniref:hypothetical protein n=1 Tax=Candidatus Thiodictyon syntrophicum TaxID=1166950 RepID=UPI0012FD62F5|nr:hypothetical protein [Candidatus Thiodictyon syntrophicum]